MMEKANVIFRSLDNEELKGTIVDKVLVAPVGGNASFNNYVVIDENKKVHVVSPFNLLVMEIKIYEGDFDGPFLDREITNYE